MTGSPDWRKYLCFCSLEQYTRPGNGSEREETVKDGTESGRAGPGPGGGGSGWARARGPATQVPLSPPGPCPPARGEWHPKGKRDRKSASANPKRRLDSTGRRHLVCEGTGQTGGGTIACVQSVRGNGSNVDKPLVVLNGAQRDSFQ